MNSKRDLFKRKPDPWHMLIRELREATPYLIFYGLIIVCFVIAFSVCIYCQITVSMAHTWGLI